MEYLVPCCSHPSTPTRASDQERRDVERANSANLRASDKASEGIPIRSQSTAGGRSEATKDQQRP